nr:hypothetical protein [Clostridia bacterium]
MDILENINELGNKLINNEELKRLQEGFLESKIGQIVNSAIDFGLKELLPDFVEDEVIEVKDAFITEGLKEGIDTAIENAINLGKNIIGIFNENYINIDQVENSLKKGEIIEGISSSLDFIINKLEKSKIISTNISELIRTGKDLILDNVDNNIENEFKNEVKSLKKIEKYIKNWEKYYSEKNIEGVTTEFNKIKKQFKNIIPLENIINEVRKIDNINQLIENSNEFNFDELYLNIAEKI